MNYCNESVRRQDRLLSKDEAVNLLRNARYGILAMQAESNGAYAVPVSYVWDGDETIYFHCAKEGEKLQCINLCPDVSICIVGDTNVHPDKFTTEYESILLRCKANLGLTDDEKMKALELILDKFSPDDKIIGMKYAAKSFSRTEIVRLHIVEWSGKAKKLKRAV
jgi:nitroimidazol reductase NimA-like FMN-containing flavoprotein (pyridoxamine 5'-phosphate oxidase superfamily)